MGCNAQINHILFHIFVDYNMWIGFLCLHTCHDNNFFRDRSSFSCVLLLLLTTITKKLSYKRLVIMLCVIWSCQVIVCFIRVLLKS